MTSNSIQLKQSFERFGDDLCELIVSYLSIDDKIKFQCISKQFKRLVFNKQRHLRLSNVKSDDTIHGLFVRQSNSRYQSIDLKTFDLVLKKLKLLYTLRIEGRINVDSNLIQLIAINCHQLRHLLINVRFISDISVDCLKMIGQSCGQTLRSIKFNGLTDNQMKHLLKLTPNLQSITVDNIRTVVGDQKTNKCQQILPQLQEIQFCRCNLKALTEFQTQYSKSLTKIKTHLLTLDLKSDNMNRALSGFSRFSSLESLDLMIDVCNVSDVQSIDIGLRQLATDCHGLRQLCFTLDGNLLQTNLFDTFGRFQTLSSLEIFIISDQELGEYSYSYGKMDSLKHLKNLKHLSLHLEQLSDENVVNIDKYLPQLKSIRLNTSKPITDKSLEFMSRLKSLSKLEITCFTSADNENITDSGVRQVIKECLKIQSLSLDQKNSNFDFDINTESIETLIERAKQMPKIQYNFSFAINCCERINAFNQKSNDLPNNLSIEIL